MVLAMVIGAAAAVIGSPMGILFADESGDPNSIPIAEIVADTKDYIHASKFLDFIWSEKLGYLLLHIDPTKNTIEEDQIIASADELCAELFNEVATDVFQEAKREHFYPDADDDEIAEIRRRWQPYLDLLPEYRSSCRAFHTAE